MSTDNSPKASLALRRWFVPAVVVGGTAVLLIVAGILFFRSPSVRNEVPAALSDGPSVTPAVSPSDAGALTDAILRGDLQAAQLRVAAGESLSRVDPNGWTYLHLAAVRGHASVVEWLLDQKLSSDAQDNLGQTSLQLAILGGHDRVVTLLNPRTGTMADSQRWALAIRSGSVDGVRALLEAGADPKSVDPSSGMSPVHLAAMHHQASILKLLLDRSTGPMPPTPQKRTPLHIAAICGAAECAALLARAGYDVNAVDGSDYAPLHLAACVGHDQVVKVLLAAGARIDMPSPGGTALQLAAEHGRLNALEVLAGAASR